MSSPASLPRPMAAVSTSKSLAETFGEIFTLDLRSLALFRVCLGLLLLGEILLERILDLTVHYTGAGVVPISVLGAGMTLPVSIHILSDSWGYQFVLFLVQIACAGGLLVGYQTRLMTLLSWFLLISIHAKNPALMHGGDTLLRMLLFWGMFLPLGACWSVDARRADKPAPPSPKWLTVASAALLLQVCFVYWFAVVWKSDPVWRNDGTAVDRALHIDAFAAPFGVWLRQFTSVTYVLTFASLYLETLGPALLLFPFYNAQCRVVAIFSFIAFHSGLGWGLELGSFPYVCFTAWLALLPSWFWNKLAARWPRFGWPPPSAPDGPGESLPRPSPVENALAAFFLWFVLMFNIRSIDYPWVQNYFPVQLNPFANALGLDQSWGMFAPYPGKAYGWFVVPAQLADGSEIDLFKAMHDNFRQGEPVNWAKPKLVSATYINSRWRRYLMNLTADSYSGLRPTFAQYLVREWNERHPHRRVESVKVVYMLQHSEPEDRDKPAVPITLFQWPPPEPGKPDAADKDGKAARS